MFTRHACSGRVSLVCRPGRLAPSSVPPPLWEKSAGENSEFRPLQVVSQSEGRGRGCVAGEVAAARAHVMHIFQGRREFLSSILLPSLPVPLLFRESRKIPSSIPRCSLLSPSPTPHPLPPSSFSLSFRASVARFFAAACRLDRARSLPSTLK